MYISILVYKYIWNTMKKQLLNNTNSMHNGNTIIEETLEDLK
jgi:hypothetical protein